MRAIAARRRRGEWRSAGRRIPVLRKLFFPERGFTKLDLIQFYLDLAEPVINHLRDRPTALKRYAAGAAGAVVPEAVGDSAPPWLQTADGTFPSGRSARELLPSHAAHLVVGAEPWG
ncbi:MAG: hypothetical protein ACLP8S_10300 [Solirubrobacteraceae bacterium]